MIKKWWQDYYAPLGIKMVISIPLLVISFSVAIIIPILMYEDGLTVEDLERQHPIFMSLDCDSMREFLVHSSNAHNHHAEIYENRCM